MAINATSMFHKITRMKAPTTKIGEELKWWGFGKIGKTKLPQVSKRRFSDSSYESVLQGGSYTTIIKSSVISKNDFFTLKVIEKRFSNIYHENKIKFVTILYVHKFILFKRTF
jgi:hypothetical protein